MQIDILDKSEYHKISHLWERLNQHHKALSRNFKHHFASFTFNDRMAGLHGRDHVVVFVVRHNDDGENEAIVGYCIASVDQGRGEVDSIYIEPSLQCKGVGTALMNKALTWLDGHHCREVRVSVSVGNEAVLDFYRQFGFHERLMVLQRKDII